MLHETLNFLQQLLLPLVLGALVVGGLVVYLVGRKPGATPAHKPAHTPAHKPASNPGAQPGIQPGARPAAQPARAAQTTPDTATTLQPAAAVARPAAPSPALPLRADLLLVDDSAVVRAKLRRLFEPAGYRIALARDGEEALALLAQGRYALLVTDLEMPKLDGVGLVRATLAQPACAGMPILAITGHDDLQAQLSQLHAVAGIYRKPWVDDDLLGHVHSLVVPSGVPTALAAEA